MTWIIGCDEAGYGPPLGPFTQASVAIQALTLSAFPFDMWHAFPTIFKKRKDSGKFLPGHLPLLVDDSKLINQLINKNIHLAAPWSCLFIPPDQSPKKLIDFLSLINLSGFETLKLDPTYDANYVCTWWIEKKLRILAHTACLQSGLFDCRARVSMMTPHVFNQEIEQTNNKSLVLEKGWKSHLEWWLDEITGQDPLFFFSDKLGGRTHYASLFQEAVGQRGLVQILQESSTACLYRVLGAGREITLVVQPKADSFYFPTSLASMLAKHAREWGMDLVNRFWAKYIPNLRPTAGYPVDGKRFMEQIEIHLLDLEIPRIKVWRNR